MAAQMNALANRAESNTLRSEEERLRAVLAERLDIHTRFASLPGTRSPPTTAWTVTSPCGSSALMASRSTLDGSGTPTVTLTSIVPPR